MYAVTNTTFQLSATPSTSATELKAGISIYDHVAQDRWDYFSFQVPKSPAGQQPIVTFSMTVFVGDPDMYIAWDYDRPNSTHYQARSATSGLAKDVVIMYPPEQADSNHARCYRELASSVLPTPMRGIAAPALAEPRADPAIVAQLEAQGMRVLSVTRESGTSGLRGANAGDRVLVAAQPLFSSSSVLDYGWDAAAAGRPAENPLQAVGDGYCSVVAGPCTYYIGVTGYRSNASFAILARTSAANVTQLRSGQVVTDYVPAKEY